jgi:hypothetical protein
VIKEKTIYHTYHETTKLFAITLPQSKIKMMFLKNGGVGH